MREGLLGRLDDSVNPIVVKELRQAVQGKFVASVLILLLVIQLIALGLFLISGDDFSNRLTAGRDAFMILQTILLAVCLLFVPAYTGARLAFERSDANVDLLFITTIKPVAIVGGKVFSSLTITVLIFSACMPFMVFTYWLRGIDLPSIFVVLGLAFLEVAVYLHLATFVACVPSGRVLKILLAFVTLIILFWGFVGTVGTSYSLLTTGVGSRLYSWTFWGPATAVLINAAVTIGLLFFTSVAMLKPVSANRALPVRAFISAMWLGGLLFSAIVSSVERDNTALGVWGIVSAVVFSGAFFVAVSERESLGLRVTRRIPRNPGLRAIAFLFFSGGASGVAWAALMSVLTVAALSALLMTSSGMREVGGLREVRVWMIGLPLYALAYSLSALLVRRHLLRRWMGPKYTWGVGLIMLAGGCVVPFLIGYLAFFGNWSKTEEIGAWLIFNPFALGVESFKTTYLTIAGGWALIALAVNFGWLITQVKSFRPVGPRPDTAAPEIESAAV